MIINKWSRAFIYSFTALVGALSVAQQYVPGEVIIKLKSDFTSEETYAFFGKAQLDKEMVLRRSYGKMNTYHFNLKSGASMDQTLAELRADPNVEYAEPNWILRKASLDDNIQALSQSDIQALADETNEFLSTSAPIQAMEAWSAPSMGSIKPIVAIVDTGLDINHKVFVDSQAVWVNHDEIPGNGIDDDGNGYVDDVNGWNYVSQSGLMIDDDGHGTHVAGIVLSIGQNIFLNPFQESKIEIMPLKFLNENGIGSTVNAISAIYYAVNNGAKVINNSWGGTGYSRSLHEAMVYAYDRGVLMVSAAGNNALNNDRTPMYPANLEIPSNISIAATTNSDSLASFSNYGAGSVHIGSPGVFILSTIPGDGYGSSSGTSMSVPFVAGLAALILIESPNMLGYQIKNLILDGADQVRQLTRKVSGEARISIAKSIHLAKTATLSSSQPSYTIRKGYATFRPQKISRSLASSGGGCGLVAKVYSDFHKDQKSGRGHGPHGGPNTWYVLFIIGILGLPLALVSWLRAYNPQPRRKYDRFKVNSEVRLKVGEKELIGSLSSISLGGVQVNTEALLNQGGMVSMTISNPSGSKEQITMNGHVVWREECKSYGVQFVEAKGNVLDQISSWTKNLKKIS